MRRSIVWFKTDLRLHDNETLIRAIEESDEVIPVYCFDEAHFKTTAFGFKKTGNFRARFLLESLTNLDENLRSLGAGLIVSKGKPEEEIYQIAKRYNAQKIFAKKEVTYEETVKEELVEKRLWTLNCVRDKFSTSTLYHAEDLPFSIKDIPDVYTSFRKKIEKEASVRPVFKKPKSIPAPTISALKLPCLEELGLTSVNPDDRKSFTFKGGETEGLSRVHTYLFKKRYIDSYKETRNALSGANYSTKFSAWLALGCISPRAIYAELKKYEGQFSANKSTYWLEFELLWRDYFRFMMKKYRNKFFQQNGIKSGEAPLADHNPGLLQKWVDGDTGDDFIDANMLELKHTGYMSNRGRQNVASYLCNDLKLDWRFGAAYFEQQLIDYDVCSNWGNWAYLAGVGNDPRGKRVFNINKQAEDYDPDQSYRKLWLKKK